MATETKTSDGPGLRPADHQRAGGPGPWSSIVEWAGRLPRGKLAWGALGLAALTALAANVIGGTALKQVRADLTKDGLFTISDGTKRVLRSIDEPIQARLYFSKQLGDAAPAYLKYFERVRTLLEQYRDLAGGRFQLQVVDPEPFSDAEDRAVAAGLRGVRLNRDGDTGYFGLAAENSTDNTAVVEFFSPERERFLEYDLSKLVWGLVNPKKRVVGLIAGVPINGSFNPQGGMQPPWQIMEQISEFFDVKELGNDPKTLPENLDVLMLVQPETLSDETLLAIDQFALKGGRILAFVDPNAEQAQPKQGMQFMMPGAATSPLDKLFKAWGVAYDPTKVAVDKTRAKRVQFGGGRQPVVTDYVAWVGLDRSNMEDRDVLTNGIETLNIASAGHLEKIEGATTSVTPILRTSPTAMVISGEQLKPMPDPVALLRGFQPGGKPLTLAARVTGDAKTAFPDGLPKAEAKPEDKDAPAAKGKAEPAKKGADKAKSAADKSKDGAKDGKAQEAKASGPPPLTTGKLNIIVVADTDFLADQFWVELRSFGDQKIAIPNAHNATFVLNALENLSGGEVLTGLRGRGINDRPFTMVDDIRREGERKFREKEQTLVARLKEVQQQLAGVETQGDGKVVLTDKERTSVESFKRDMIDIRRELRDVKLAMRQDVDRLDGILKLVNIAGVPALIGLGALGLGWSRRRRTAETVARTTTDRSTTGKTGSDKTGSRP